MHHEFTRRGTDFVRLAIAAAVARAENADLVNVAASRWGQRANITALVKSAVAAGGVSGDWAGLADLEGAAQEFLEAVTPQTILGRLPGVWTVDPLAPYAAAAANVTSYWRPEGGAAPVSAAVLDRDSLTALDLTCLVVLTNELLNATSDAGEAFVRRLMLKSVAELMDRTLLSDAAGIAGKQPPGLLYDLSGTPASGDLTADLDALVGGFTGDLQTSAFVLHPRLAAQIALKSGGRGVGADLGVLGGTLLGLPALASSAVHFDSAGGDILLIDGAGLVVADDGVTIGTSNTASIELDDAPGQDSLSPSGPSGAMVSLWQNELTGILLTRRVNWIVAREGAVAALTGADYTGA